MGRWGAIALTQVALLVVVTVGLQERWGAIGVLGAAGLAGVGFGLMRKPLDSRERLMQELYCWGVFWLGLGLVLEPYEMGIKKDPPTLSYYFVCTGLAIFALIACSIAIHKLRGPKAFSLTIANGQNPMIAYAGLANLTRPMLALVGLEQLLEPAISNPWLGLGYGVATVWLTAAIVRWLTGQRIVWKT